MLTALLISGSRCNEWIRRQEAGRCVTSLRRIYGVSPSCPRPKMAIYRRRQPLCLFRISHSQPGRFLGQLYADHQRSRSFSLHHRSVNHARPRPKRRGSVELWLAGFLLFALASTTWSVSSHATFLKAASLVSGYICIGLLVRYYDNLEHAMVGLLSFVHLLLLLTAFEALFLHHLAFQAAGSLNRLILVFPQTGSDVLATVCLVGLVGVVTNIGPRIMQGGRARVLLAGVYVTELLATRTRTALVLAGILLLLGAITWSRRSAHALPAVTGGIVVVIITLVLGGTALSAFFYRHETSGALATLTGRTVYWSEAVSAWKTSPLDGLGYYSGHREAVLTQPGQTTRQPRRDLARRLL